MQAEESFETEQRAAQFGRGPAPLPILSGQPQQDADALGKSLDLGMHAEHRRHRVEAAQAPRRLGVESAFLLALMVAARDDALAARIVLQRILPALAGLARRGAGTWADRQDLLDELVANAWLRIRSYPVERRPHRVAANEAIHVA